MNLNQTNIRPLKSDEPKSKENLYLHKGKIYQYTGEEGKVIEELTDEFKETTVDLADLLNLMAHTTEDEEEYKVLCEMSDMAYDLIENFRRIQDEVEQLRFMVAYY